MEVDGGEGGGLVGCGLAPRYLVGWNQGGGGGGGVPLDIRKTLLRNRLRHGRLLGHRPQVRRGSGIEGAEDPTVHPKNLGKALFATEACSSVEECWVSSKDMFLEIVYWEKIFSNLNII